MMQDMPDQLGERSKTPWMTVQEAAAYLSVSPGTIRNWVSQRYIPFVKRGRVVRFHRDRVDEWLDRGACAGRSRRTPGLGATVIRARMAGQ